MMTSDHRRLHLLLGMNLEKDCATLAAFKPEQIRQEENHVKFKAPANGEIHSTVLPSKYCLGVPVESGRI